ncbi:MAG: acetyl-CoA decarbonylase/synthase complex subunit gamma [bacterium]
MALTGLEIFKHLPKTNCGECGFPTCLAFAMQLAAKKAALDKCPYVSDEAKSALDAAAAPPIRLITVGVKKPFQTGNETVMFRHEETFHRPTGIAVTVSDAAPEDEIAARAGRIAGLSFERVGMQIGVNLTAVRNDSGDPAKFAAAVKKVMEVSQLPIVLTAGDPAAMERALEVCKEDKPLIHGATAATLDAMCALAKASSCPLTVSGGSLDDLAALARDAAAKGVQDVVLDPGPRGMNELLRDVTQSRRLALKKNYRPLGYPFIITAAESDPVMEMVEVGVFIAKYGGIVVTNAIEKWQMLPLLTLRQNVFTDPRKPIMVEPKLNKVGEPGRDAPVLVTTNFSLTYFVVEGEVEASKVPSYLISVDTEGLSVLTAWAAEKFTPESIKKALESSGVSDLVDHKKFVIPGYVAVMSGELEEETGREVLVGPREASGISTYLKTVWKA